MADNIPDPRTLDAVETAFRYPVPTVRIIEKKLRGNLEEGRERLRGVVGSSYRELLGTARTIVEINGQLQQVEALLADVGRKSDSRFIEKIGSNYARFERQLRREDTSRLALASQVAVLQSALGHALRILKENGSTLLATKLLVVARLLHKTLSQGSGDSPLVQSLGRRLAALRQKLLRHIDRRLVRTYVNTESLVEDMTAFSLATSSTSVDVLKHFQSLRMRALAKSGMASGNDIQTAISSRLQLFLGTMREARMIFPDLIGASLRVLGSRLLLRDDMITSIAELDLDIHEQWFSDEVRNFTPYTRQDTLSVDKASSLIGDWGRDALHVLAEAITCDLASESELKNVATVRKEVLQMWLPSKRDAQGMNARQVLEELRAPFMHRMELLIKDALESLQESFSNPIVNVLDNWSIKVDEISCKSLWDPSIINMELGDGAMLFRQAIVDRRMGTSSSIKMILQGFENRAKVLEDIQTVIKEMKGSRWDDDFDDDDEEDEDNADYEPTRDSLTRADPQELQIILIDSAKDFVRNTEDFFTIQLRDRLEDCSNATSPGIWALRIVRGLRARLPRLLAPISKQLSQTLLCQDLVQSLQSGIRETVNEKTTATLADSLDSFVISPRQVRVLWDGAPSLPVMPTPATFRYLRVVVKEMETLGTDLWNPELARMLKGTLKMTVSGELKRVLDVLQEGISAESNTSAGASLNGVAGEYRDADKDEHAAEDTGSEAHTDAESEKEKEARSEPPKTEAAEAKEEEDNYVSKTILAAPNSASTPRPASPNSTVPSPESNDDEINNTQKSPAEEENERENEKEKPLTEATATTTTSTEPLTTSPSTPPPQPPQPVAVAENDPLRTRRLALTHDKLTQLLFDVAYLQHALSTSTSTSSTITPKPASSSTTTTTTTAPAKPPDSTALLSLTSQNITTLRRTYQRAISTSQQEHEDQDEDAELQRERQRLEKAAAEYWRRTYALFGLLGVS